MEIDFYHIDSFEVHIFYPIIKKLLKLGVNVRPVLATSRFMTASPVNLDVEYCRSFYYGKKIEVFNFPKYKNVVCSTQPAEFLALYYGLRIRIPYGPGIYPLGWGMRKTATIGYDYIFVHGKYYKNYISSFFPKEKIIIGGYPRYQKEYEKISKTKSLSKKKPKILFLPTWNSESIEIFASIANTLTNKFQLIIKPHHKTLKEKNLTYLKKVGVKIHEQNEDLPVLISNSDIVICDIRSCVLTEAVILNKYVIGFVSDASDKSWILNSKIDKFIKIAYDKSDLNFNINCKPIYPASNHEFIKWSEDRVAQINENSNLSNAKLIINLLGRNNNIFNFRRFMNLLLSKTFVFLKIPTKFGFKFESYLKVIILNFYRYYEKTKK